MATLLKEEIDNRGKTSQFYLDVYVGKLTASKLEVIRDLDTLYFGQINSSTSPEVKESVVLNMTTLAEVMFSNQHRREQALSMIASEMR